MGIICRTLSMGSARDRGLQRCAIIAAYLASWPARPSAPPGARRKNHMLSPCTMRHLVAILTTFACFGAVALSRMSSHQAKMVGTSPATAAGSCFMLIYVDTTGCSGGNGDERDCSKGYQGRRCNQCTEYNDRMCEAGSDVARALTTVSTTSALMSLQHLDVWARARHVFCLCRRVHAGA
jgi:hypothetical protein